MLNIVIEIIALLAAAISDIRSMTVPLFLLPSAMASEILILLMSQENHAEAFICAGAAFLIMLVPAVFVNGGGADALAACSLCLALDGRAGLYALILGELCTVPYLLFRKKESKTKDYPLIPFLFAGFLVVLLFEGWNGI